MTQEELGSLLGVKKAAVQKIESGRSSNITIDKLIILCQTFRTLPAILLYGSYSAFWENVHGIKPVEEKIQLDDIHLVSKLNALAELRFGQRGMHFLQAVDVLNDDGLDRVIAYVNDLSKIEDYRSDRIPD